MTIPRYENFLALILKIEIIKLTHISFTFWSENVMERMPKTSIPDLFFLVN